MANSRIQYDTVVGVDVSKNWFDVRFGSRGEEVRYKRSFKSILSFVKKVAATPGQTFVVIEATGGLQKRIVKVLNKAGILFCVVNPRQIRDFAKALGLLAKTDKLDAHVITLFGETVELTPTELPLECEERLQSLTRRRKDLVEFMTAEKNRLSGCEDDKETARDIAAHLNFLEKRKAKLEKQIAELIEETVELKTRKAILETVPGVGEITSAILIAELPELGRLNRKQIAKLVGLAPMNDESGKHTGRAYIRGGRKPARNALYMSAMVAVQRNPYFKEFYQRLLKAGKKPILALVAVMRKMLTILNALVRDGRNFSTILEITT